jgi:hypothetical protein
VGARTDRAPGKVDEGGGFASSCFWQDESEEEFEEECERQREEAHEAYLRHLDELWLH